MASPDEILVLALNRAQVEPTTPLVPDPQIASSIARLCQFEGNRAPIRFLLACALAKAHRPDLDTRKPYTEIGGQDSFSGRNYDETFITPFVLQHQLPCNPTTAFLTPALRVKNQVITPDFPFVSRGQAREIFRHAATLLTNIQNGTITAHDVLAESIRQLLLLREAQRSRLTLLMQGLLRTEGVTQLSSEAIVGLVERHLASQRSSRLPVLVITAVYRAAEQKLGERALNLFGHNAADQQTGAMGDLEIAIVGDDAAVTSYEMKTRRVTQSDIDQALLKIERHAGRLIDNYIFITTEVIERSVQEYATTMYSRTGIEFVVLDCISFLRHFLHLFHRIRGDFLSAYQQLVLSEPDSAVSHALKEAFLALRRAAESENAES